MTLLREPDPTAPLMTRRDLLRGSFAIVEYKQASGSTEVRIVLLGFEPENRKLVFESAELGHYLSGLDPLGPITVHVVQDSPGMARDVAS